MLSILASTASIYAIILLGYLTGRFELFTQIEFRALGKFVINIAVPALLFTTLSIRPIADIMHVTFLAAYTLGSVTVFLAGAAYARFVQGKSMPLAALSGLGMSSSNSALIAYPVAQQVVGPAAAVALAMCTVIENMLMQPMMLALAEPEHPQEKGRRQVAMQSLARLAGNPFIIAIVAGALVSWFKLDLPEPIRQVIGTLSMATAALSLFVVGGTLVGLKLGAMLWDVMLIAFGKLVLHPLSILAMAWILPPMPRDLLIAAVVFASVPMLSIYPIWGQRFGQERFCAGALLGTTVFSFLTVSAMLWIVS
jgi:malonate transporter and related proteins